jgi:hypothetical protein
MKLAPLFRHPFPDLIQALPGHQVNTKPGNRIASQAGTDMLGSA